MVEVNIVLCDGVLEYGNNLRIVFKEQIIPKMTREFSHFLLNSSMLHMALSKYCSHMYAGHKYK